MLAANTHHAVGRAKSNDSITASGIHWNASANAPAPANPPQIQACEGRLAEATPQSTAKPTQEARYQLGQIQLEPTNSAAIADTQPTPTIRHSLVWTIQPPLSH